MPTRQEKGNADHSPFDSTLARGAKPIHGRLWIAPIGLVRGDARVQAGHVTGTKSLSEIDSRDLGSCVPKHARHRYARQ